MDAVAELLVGAGPWAGWAVSGLLIVGALWAYVTERIVTRGRHHEVRKDRDYYRHHFAESMELLSSSLRHPQEDES